MEITATLLGYPQVYTDFKFIHIPTVPPAERCAIEKEAAITKITKNIKQCKIDDFDSGEIIPQYYIRNIALKESLPIWRQYSYSETLLMKDQMFSNLSFDNVTLFGLRPPELRFVKNIKLYYQWFYFENADIKDKTFSNQVSVLENVIKVDIKDTRWIDGIGRNVYVRPGIIDNILEYIESRENKDFFSNENSNINATNISSNLLHAKYEILSLFNTIKFCINKTIENNSIEAENDITALYFLNCDNANDLKRLLNEKPPIIYFSSIKPSHGARWLLHLMLSMGEIENEYNLYCQPNIRTCFVKCKLLSSDYTRHENDLKDLARRYILEQLNYIPGGSRKFERNVIAAYQTLKYNILFERAMSSEMPPMLHTQLQTTISNECKQHIEAMKLRLIKTCISKISTKTTIQIPSYNDFIQSTKSSPLSWNIIDSVVCGPTQSIESFKEQNDLLQYATKCLNEYVSITPFIHKNIIICGGPGVGKTTILQMLTLYAASIGLNVHLTTIISERSSQLGGLHISKMFAIPTTRNQSPSIIAEKAVYALLRQPKQLILLQNLEFLAIDEFGQVSAELITILDIILRTVRKNSSFMGGIFIIATMDNMQLPPVNGRPPLLSPHMINSFTFKVLSKSVRASQDLKLQEIQNISRLYYSEIKPEDIARFRYLIENYCTHVNDFSHPMLSVQKLRLFGKRSAKQLAEATLLASKHKEFSGKYIVCKSLDFESTLESQWDKASETTSSLLSRHVKEPQKLSFYPYATFEITFNSEGKFSQGQIAVLAEMPTKKK